MKPHCKFFITGIFAVCLLSVFTAGCEKSGQEVKKAPRAALPVAAAPAVVKDIPEAIDVIGRVEAYSSVEVKSQAEGILSEVHFREGDSVKKGQLLFTINQAPYRQKVLQDQAQVRKSSAGIEQAKANYSRSVALQMEAGANYDKAVAHVKQLEANYEKTSIQQKNAEDTEKRYAKLLEGGFTTEEQYNKTKTDLDVLSATLKADSEEIKNAQAEVRAAEAALESSKASAESSKAAILDAQAQLDVSKAQSSISSIDLNYCEIYSPIDGTAGSILVKQGSLVKTSGDQRLVLINQIQPVYVTCSVPEKYLASLKPIINTGEMKAESLDKAQVSGKLVFIDNQVDQTTGTILIKAVFPNKDSRLWPGQYVKSLIVLNTVKHAVTVPTVSIQTGQSGKYVFVIGQDSKAHVRTVKTGVEFGGNTVILEGVKSGENIVTDGFLKLVEDMKVTIKE